MASEGNTLIYIPKFLHRDLVKFRKNYMQATGCQVNPSRDSKKCGVQLVGDPEQINAAIALIQEKTGIQEVSREPFETRSYHMTNQDEITLLKNQNPNIVRELCVDIQLPRPSSEVLFVKIRGSLIACLNVEKLWSEQLGRTLENVAGKEEELAFQIQLDNRDVNECLFFGAGDYDDRMDLVRFMEFLGSGMKTLDICIFTVSNDQISDTIINEHEDGVRVRIITDNDTKLNKGSDIYTFVNRGIPVREDKEDGHMHNKFAIIDGKLLINGSFNWTYQATKKNFENVVVTNNESLVNQFQGHFDELWNDEGRFIDVSFD